MARSLRRTLMVSGAAVAIGALAAIGMTSASAGTGGIGILADRTVRTGIDIPWGITFLPDRSAYVAERDTGRILRITQSGARSVVGTVPGTAFGGEGGLLGLAVAPGFNPADGRLFAYQTVSSGNRIVRIRVRSHRVGAGDVTQILRMTQAGRPPTNPPNRLGGVVFSMGHRNVQGIAWDSRGRLSASEFGPS